MTIVKELNTLGEKMTGVNPKTTTDAQAVKYIADNYTKGGGGGDAGNQYLLDLNNVFDQYDESSVYVYEMRNEEEVLEMLNALKEAYEKKTTPTAVYNDYYLPVGKYKYEENEDIYSGEFYIYYPYYVDIYSGNYADILHIVGEINSENMSTCQVTIIKTTMGEMQ